MIRTSCLLLSVSLTLACECVADSLNGSNSVGAVVARRIAEEKARRTGKRGWLPWEAERNPYFPAQDRRRVEQIAVFLPKKAVAPGDPVGNRTVWKHLAKTPEGQKRIAKARQRLAEPIPELTAAAYESYRKSGDRKAYAACNRRNEQIVDLVWGEVLEDRRAFVPKIAELLESICDEPSWVAPYEGGSADIGLPLHGVDRKIDLTAASRAYLVALTVSWLRDRLPPKTVARVIDVLRGRIFETFLKDARRKGETTPYCNWWMPDKYNWSAVCHCGCTSAILSAEDDPVVRAEAVEASERLMVPCFLGGFCGKISPEQRNFAALCRWRRTSCENDVGARKHELAGKICC